MSSISVDALEMDDKELLIVARHRRTGRWWASIGPEKGAQRAVGEGETPIAALAEMLIDLGHRPDRMA